MRTHFERALVIGGSGQLGAALREALADRDVPSLSPTRSVLDVSDTSGLAAAVAALSPSIVFNASAFTDVAAAELPKQRDVAFSLNRDAPAAIAQACARLRIPVVHVSTDYVFDGAINRPYREDDRTCPLQVYGESKLAGERRVFEEHPDALVIRTSTLFGLAPRARPNYVDAILGQALQFRAISVVELPIASPTFAPDLAAGILALVEAEATGLFHLTNDGACSRLDLARAVVKEAGRSDAVTVEPRAPADSVLRRPEYSALDVARFTAWVGFRPRPWREAVAEHVWRRRT